jgi:predicted acetyltransferase
MNPGKWEVSIIPENKKALLFWEKVISKFTGGTFGKAIKKISYDEHQPKRVIFAFDTNSIKRAI